MIGKMTSHDYGPSYELFPEAGCNDAGTDAHAAAAYIREFVRRRG